jgi:3-hydroxybutyryl-CoA dehydrogenase
MRSFEPKNVAVVGAGIMGHGFAQVFAAAGCIVTLCDLTPTILRRAVARISDNLDTFIEQRIIRKTSKLPILQRISTTTDLGDSVKSADFVLEAVPEVLKLKKKIFHQIDLAVPGHAILASTTSGLSMTEISSATRHPERTIIAHGTNPPYIIPLVELVCGQKTSDQTVNATFRFLSDLGMKPVLLKKEAPGFILNRLQFALFREALHCLQSGIATAADIDYVVRSGYGFRLPHLGPFATADFGGVDTFSRIVSNLFPFLSAVKKSPALLQQMVKAGKLGVKSGEGFYRYPRKEISKRIKDRDVRLLQQLRIHRSLETKH